MTVVAGFRPGVGARIAGISFMRTPISNGVDGGGLLVARTVLTGERLSAVYPGVVHSQGRPSSRPAVDVSWHEGASLARLFAQVDPRYAVRMITSDEYRRLVTCDGALTGEQIVARSLLRRGANTHTLPVTGRIPKGRINPWGVVDAFGHVKVWVQDAVPPFGHEKEGSSYRLLRGASFMTPPDDALDYFEFEDGEGVDPSLRYFDLGLRLVAIPQAQ